MKYTCDIHIIERASRFIVLYNDDNNDNDYNDYNDDNDYYIH